jgi:hypothetical protein
MTFMSSFDPHNHLRKVCALIAATLILPALAYADQNNQGGNNNNQGGNNNNQGGNNNDRGGIPVVPEANAGWVLIPFFGAVLLFSSRHLFRGKAAK